MTKLKIKVTKEILKKSKMCGWFGGLMSENCAVSLAVRDIFPKAATASCYIYPFGGNTGIYTSSEVANYIHEFDTTFPENRPFLPEIEFEIEISDEILERLIPIDDIKKLLTNHPTLELIEN